MPLQQKAKEFLTAGDCEGQDSIPLVSPSLRVRFVSAALGCGTSKQHHVLYLGVQGPGGTSRSHERFRHLFSFRVLVLAAR